MERYRQRKDRRSRSYVGASTQQASELAGAARGIPRMDWEYSGVLQM